LTAGQPHAGQDAQSVRPHHWQSMQHRQLGRLRRHENRGERNTQTTTTRA
jgi:hypothetical protein